MEAKNKSKTIFSPRQRVSPWKRALYLGLIYRQILIRKVVLLASTNVEAGEKTITEIEEVFKVKLTREEVYQSFNDTTLTYADGEVAGMLVTEKKRFVGHRLKIIDEQI